ncbi:MAG: class I SAM-dependent methyltransferase [Candidatus Saccharimonadales bacterium]
MTSKTKQYDNYFVEHYKSTLSEKDIITYKKWFSAQWRIIRKRVPVNKSTRVLEIGSGFGGLYSFLLEEGVKDYTGVELDKGIVDFSNNYFKTTSFKNVAIENFDSKKKFDVIFAFEVLEHIENPSEVIETIGKLLKPNGVFCGTSPYPYKKNIKADLTHVSVLHPLNWERLFINKGFKVSYMRPMSFVPVLWRYSSRLNFAVPVYVPFRSVISTCLMVMKKAS